MESIHWYPGHMAKAKRQIAEALRRVDAVLELVDARLPVASANPMLRELIGSRPRVVVLTRADMADPAQTERWQAWFAGREAGVLEVDARHGRGVDRIVPALERAAAARREREARRGIRPRAVRAMVVGIPNVGKSSLINRLAGRVAARTGDRPGVTKSQQWIRLGDVELLDTPGVLWPKLEDVHAAYRLAVSGAIKDEVLDPQLVAAYFVLWCAKRYPDRLRARYGVEDLPAVEWTDEQAAWEAAEPVLAEIGKRRGLLGRGGVPQTDRAASLLLHEVREGLLGRITLEWVEDIEGAKAGVPTSDVE
ncbi:MAG: ribosome biogenesis GTPase YlqF [Thermoflavifilum sp.]|nr:ribosome biogenesis GTPase YlqF [Thermoflavifilum sp.]MCL6513360.1 ribosome biogenesis GTPase YlqF [Alicyclobacillus sp.]